jgi:protein transport protein SEC24
MAEYDQAAGAAKKKRAYAQQAYEFGGNVPQQQSQGPPPMMGGMPAGAPLGGVPALGSPIGQNQPLMGAPSMGQPLMQANSPEQLSSQFGQMNIQSQPQASHQGQQPAQNLNQLFPSDLISQPFNVQELDLPPPPINLPPNVSGALENNDL